MRNVSDKLIERIKRTFVFVQ